MEIYETILKFDQDMKRINSGKNPLRKSIMGYYGETIVAEEFKKRGFRVEEKGGQAGYDLSVNNKKIEVRTSEIKKEWAFPKDVRAWGWKLRTRDKNKKPNPIKYDFIILVKLEEDWSNYSLFILSREDVESMGAQYFSGYQTVANAIYLFKTPIEEAIKFDKERKPCDPKLGTSQLITPKCIELNK
ncbi:hypothetical protein FJZ17_04580 [Candidatus Pacearchaeota archaeon]|nr:hypothetical protein [Candidatus Pacearchaeota archaeon]